MIVIMIVSGRAKPTLRSKYDNSDHNLVDLDRGLTKVIGNTRPDWSCFHGIEVLVTSGIGADGSVGATPNGAHCR